MSAYIRPWQKWRERIALHLSGAGFAVQAADMVAPPNSDLGDVVIPFFRLAKERGMSPALLARDAAAALTELGDATAAGPYVNLRLSDEILRLSVEDVLTTEVGAYGCAPQSDVVPILFEYAAPNTHKEIHVGHLRNFVTGVAFHSIWKAAGIPVIAVQFLNDQGSNVAKVLWMMVKLAGLEVMSLTHEQAAALLESYPIERRTGNALDRIYVAAVAEIGEAATVPPEISFIQSALEQHQPVWEFLWRETRDWCINELDGICRELGIVFDRPAPYLESDMLDEAAAIVDKLEMLGVARISEGALIVDLEAEKLGVALIRKSDGNLLYVSKDLALAYQKAADWPEVTQSFALVDDRQSHHFKQLKAILTRLDFSVSYDYLSYGLLTLKEGVMSSRKGNVITYQMIRNALLDRALSEVSQRHQDWEPAEVERVARAIAFGGMKFAILKQDSNSIITFHLEQALAFEGMTGPYCQYAVVRLRSILEKAGSLPQEGIDLETALYPAEREIILTAGKLPSIVQQAAGITDAGVDFRATQPAVLAQWCFAMAQSINAFYRDVPVLDAAPELRARHIQIARVAMMALTNGLSMLTIDVPERM